MALDLPYLRFDHVQLMYIPYRRPTDRMAQDEFTRAEKTISFKRVEPPRKCFVLDILRFHIVAQNFSTI